MHSLGRQSRRGGRRLTLRCRRGGEHCIKPTMIGHAPDSAVQVVRNVDGAVGPLRESRGTKCSPTRLFDGSGESVREDDEFARCLAIFHRLKHHVVSGLRGRRAVPRPVEGDERAVPVDSGERRVQSDQQIVGRPVCREECDGWSPRDAQTHLLTAIAAIFRPKNQLLLKAVEIAFRPTVVMTLFESNDFLGWEIWADLHFVELLPVLRELIPAMLRDEQSAVGVYRKAFAVANTAGIAISGRELLIRLARVITPRASAGLLLGAGLKARRVRHAILLLARIGR